MKKLVSGKVQYDKLLAEYRAQVADINPDNRPLVTLECETWVELLTYLEANCSRREDTNSLFRKVMINSRGHMNPNTAMLVVKTWVDSK